MKMLRFLPLAALLLGGPASAAAQTQCVSNARAGGTVDHITIPLQPCALSTSILILTAAGANTIAQPTLQMAGYPQQNIYTSTGTAPGIAAIPGANAVIMLTSTGTSWKIVSGNASTTFSGTLTVPNGGTGVTTIPTNRLVVGQGTGAISTVAAGTTGQLLVGNTSSPPSWVTAGTTGQFLAGATGASPSWTTISSSLVSSFSAGTTGFTPSSATTGAITLAGTLGVANGGTGLTTGYSNGFLPIGNGTGFTMAGLIAGTNTIITNGAGSITIATTGSTTACGGGSVAGYVLTDNGSNGCTSNPKLTFTSNTLTIGGATSGGVGFKVPAVAGSNTVTWPAGTTDFSATGGTSQVIKQTGAGAAFTVARLSCTDLSDSSSGCSGAASLTEGGPKTASFAASSNTTYCIDTTTGTATLTATLPVSPNANDVIEFVSCTDYSTWNFILSRNGKNIQGLAQDMTVNTNNASFSVKYYTSYGWRMK